MLVGHTTTVRLSKKEFREMFEKTFEQYNERDIIAVIVEISEHRVDTPRQSIVFAENLLY